MKLSELKSFEGVDIDLDIALFDYGLIWGEVEPNNYLFYYGVDYGENGHPVLFDYGHMSKDEWVELLNEDWVDIKGIESFCDNTKQELIDMFPRGVDTLLAYYGHENIFGSSYNPFEIENDII